MFAGAPPGHPLNGLDQLSRANLALRRKIDEIEAEGAAAVRDLQAAEPWRGRAAASCSSLSVAPILLGDDAEFQGAHG